MTEKKFPEIHEDYPVLSQLHVGQIELINIFVDQLEVMSDDIIYEENLLRTDFRKLLVVYQDLIRKVVRKMVPTGYFSHDEVEDVVQDVNIYLLDHESNIKNSYQNRSTIRGFFYTTINRYCHDIALKKSKRPYMGPIGDDHDKKNAPEISQLSHLIIKDETCRLGRVLQTYPKQRNRIELMLRLLYHIPLEKEDILKAYPQVEKDACSDLANQINQLLTSTDKEIFEAFSQCINRYGFEQVLPRSLSRWINGIIQELIHLMNHGTVAKTSYDNESFQLLVEHYFKNF